MWTYSNRCTGHGTCLNGYLCMRETMTTFSHTMMYWCQQRGVKNKCSSCEDRYEIGQQWQWKQQCPQQQKQNGVFTMKAKLWNRGENNSVHNDAALTLKTKFHNNGDKSIENSSVTTTWHSHFGDKIMKHWWQQHWKQQCSQQSQPSQFWRQNHETPVTTRSAAHFNYEIMRH
jgi:hypothetical protein